MSIKSHLMVEENRKILRGLKKIMLCKILSEFSDFHH